MITDERNMALALEQAVEAKQNGEWSFGAVIVQGDTVISRNRCREAAEK
jgi:tRNA(Arg) A34 adenosine deaminase TadA